MAERIKSVQVEGIHGRVVESFATPVAMAAVAQGITDDQAGELLVGQAAGHAQQVLPVLLLGVGVHQHVLRRVVHAAQVARVHAVAATPFARRAA